MRIVVTDACIFIDVIERELTGKFFDLNLEIHTTADVLNELYPVQLEILEHYKATSKLTVHVLTGEEQVALMNEEYPRALTPEDRSVIFIANKLGEAIVLSSDKPVRNYAKRLSIEYHGMLWIFDQLVDQKLLTEEEAIVKITELASSNIIYKNNFEMQEEIKKRIETWSNE